MSKRRLKRRRNLLQVVEDELSSVPDHINTRLAYADSVSAGVLEEIKRQHDESAPSVPYDLLVVGASEEWVLRTRLFGSIDDQLADEVPCSALLVRRHEPAASSWIRRRVKTS